MEFRSDLTIYLLLPGYTFRRHLQFPYLTLTPLCIKMLGYPSSLFLAAVGFCDLEATHH